MQTNKLNAVLAEKIKLADKADLYTASVLLYGEVPKATTKHSVRERIEAALFASGDAWLPITLHDDKEHRQRIKQFGQPKDEDEALATAAALGAAVMVERGGLLSFNRQRECIHEAEAGIASFEGTKDVKALLDLIAKAAEQRAANSAAQKATFASTAGAEVEDEVVDMKVEVHEFCVNSKGEIEGNFDGLDPDVEKIIRGKVAEMAERHRAEKATLKA